MTLWLEDGQQVHIESNKAGTIPSSVLIALFGAMAFLWVARLLWVAASYIIEKWLLQGSHTRSVARCVVCKMLNPFTIKRS
jgi:hypothetical protein